MSNEPQAAASGEEAPGMPQYRGLKTAVIVMGVLLVIGFIVVFSTIIYRTVNLGSEVDGGVAPPDAGFERMVALPAGARIERVTPDSDRVLIDAVLPDQGRLIIVLDPRRGREIGRFRVAPQ